MKSVLLVNPISGRGHLDSYARLYSRALIELGYRVILVAATDGGCTDYLLRNVPNSARSFSFVSFDQAAGTAPRGHMKLAERARMVWRDEGAFGLMMRCVRVPCRALVSLVPKPVQRQAGRIWRALGRHLLRTRIARALKLPAHFDGGRIPFRTLCDYAGNASQIAGHAPGFLFFLYLDLMAEMKRNTVVLDRPGMPPWSGILFHPRLVSGSDAGTEGYFQSENARGGVFLVPEAITAYTSAMPHLHFALAPDVADLELPAAPPKLAHEIRSRAGDRTVVLQIGSITAHKGIPTLLDVISAADPDRFYFALVGEVHWETFGPQKARVRSFYASPPENVFLFQEYVDSERDYNGVLEASDIIYAVYQNFGSSSNSLTKAAGLCRPILVSDASLMGERVRLSNIGAVAPEENAAIILERLNWLAMQPAARFGFAEFSREQSLESLKVILADALNSWAFGPRNAPTPARTPKPPA